jgi:hypothetical protein
MDGWLDVVVEIWMVESVDGLMDGWMDRQIDRQIDKKI